MTKETISSKTSSTSNISSQSNSDIENSRNNIDNSSSDIIDLSNNISKNDEFESNTSEVAKKLDPTHFGDWQINCKTIDF
jgi:hypothetical protein